MNKSSNFAGIVGKKKPKGKSPQFPELAGRVKPAMKPPAKKGKRK